MPANFVRFCRPESVAAISKELKDENVVVASASLKGLEELRERAHGSGPKLFSCAIVDKKDNSALQKTKKAADFAAVMGSSPEMCAWAANSKGVDFLLQPFSAEKCFLDIQTANVLSQNGIAVAILFSDFLNAQGFRLSQMMKNASMCIRLCCSAGAKAWFVSGARTENEMRAAKDLSSFAVLLGMRKEEALKSARQDFLQIKGAAK